MPADSYVIAKVVVKTAASIQLHARQCLVFHGIYILHHSSQVDIKPDAHVDSAHLVEEAS